MQPRTQLFLAGCVLPNQTLMDSFTLDCTFFVCSWFDVEGCLLLDLDSLASCLLPMFKVSCLSVKVLLTPTEQTVKLILLFLFVNYTKCYVQCIYQGLNHAAIQGRERCIINHVLLHFFIILFSKHMSLIWRHFVMLSIF